MTNTLLFELPTDEDWASDDVIIEDIQEQRAGFSTATEWRDYVQFFLPELDAEEEFLTKLKENSLERQSFCGKPYIYVNDKGIPVLGKHRCGKCEDCLRDEASAIRKAVLDVEGPVNILNTSLADKDKEIRRLRDKGISYQAFFTDQGCSILVNSSEVGETFNRKQFDYIQFTNTIPGKRRSGNLIPSSRSLVSNANPKEDEIIDSGSILTKKIFPKFEKLPDGFNSLEELMETIRYNVLSKTYDYAPKTLEEIQVCVKSREDLIIKQIRELGGVVYGVEYYRSSTRYVTEDTPQEWLDAAQKYLKDKMVQLKFE